MGSGASQQVVIKENFPTNTNNTSTVENFNSYFEKENNFINNNLRNISTTNNNNNSQIYKLTDDILDNYFNIVFVGNTQVGKSTMINKLLKKPISSVGKGKSETLIPIRIINGIENESYKNEIKDLAKLRNTKMGDIYMQEKYIYEYSMDISHLEEKQKISIYDLPGLNEKDNDVERYMNIIRKSKLVFLIITKETLQNENIIKFAKKIYDETYTDTKIYIVYNQIYSIIGDDDIDEKEIDSILKSISATIKSLYGYILNKIDIIFTSPKDEQSFNANILNKQQVYTISKLPLLIKREQSNNYNDYDKENNKIKKHDYEIYYKIKNYSTKLQEGENKIIPEKLFESAFNYYLTCQDVAKKTNIGVGGSIATSAPIAAVTLGGIFGSIPGLIIGGAVGGIIAGTTMGITSIVDKLAFNNIPNISKIKYYKNYKKIGSGFDGYCHEDFKNNKNYKDEIMFELDIHGVMEAGFNFATKLTHNKQYKINNPSNIYVKVYGEFEKFMIKKIYKIEFYDQNSFGISLPYWKYEL
jgi:ribosome biogenesis GTPase A